MSQIRISRLAKELAAHGFDAYFARTASAMGYLHGFRESGHERFLTLAVSASSQLRLIAPSLSETQARRAGIEDIAAWKDGEDPIALFRQLAEDWGLKTAIIAVDDEMPAHMLLPMQLALPSAIFKPGSNVIATLIRRKSEDELARLRRAAQIADVAFVEVSKRLRAGLSEAEVAAMLSAAMKERGGEPAFAIVATGAAGAEPHHETSSDILKSGDIVILDFGCKYDGYHSDITRTVAVGSATDEQQVAYAAVLAAHKAGRAAARAGETAGHVDFAARSVLDGAGLGSYFVHRTGHGIGTDVHEPPSIAPGSDVVLQVGDCFSVEPGVYLPGEFGIRIENIVTITDSGCDSFNAEPAEALAIVG